MIATKRLHRTAAMALLSLVSAVPYLAAAAPGAAPDADAAAKWSIRVAAARRLTEEVIYKVQPGMTQDDIKAMVGPPLRTTRFARSHTTAWEYDYHDAWGYDAEFAVIFDDAGLVVSKVSVRRDVG